MSVRHAPVAVCLLAFAALAAAPVPALALGDTEVTANQGVAAGGSITGSTITVGMPPVQVQALVLTFTQQLGFETEARAKAEAQAAQFATQLGFTREAVIGFFRILGEQEVPLEQMPTELGEIAGRYRDLTDRLAVLEPEDPGTEELLDRAKQAVKVGRYDEADELLAQAEGVEKAAARQAKELAQQAQEAADRRLLKAAAMRGERGQIALTQLRYPEAANHFAEAAELVPPSQEQVNAGYRERHADALYRQGDQRGDKAALIDAIAIYQGLLGSTKRERDPLDWSRTKTNLGNALTKLGEREGSIERLEEAVAAYRAALQEQTRERDPLGWARTLTALSNAIAILGEHEGSIERLEEAVAIYRTALQEQTRERDPLGWAQSQSDLGTTLVALSELLDGSNALGKGTERLAEAVAAFRAALEQRTRERDPLGWAKTQNNIAKVLARTGRLEEAVAAYRAALEEMTREKVPLLWARGHTNLGATLAMLNRLEEAVAAYRAALEELTRERAPLDWAITLAALSAALEILGQRGGSTERLEEAVKASTAAITILEPMGMTSLARLTRNVRDRAVCAKPEAAAKFDPRNRLQECEAERAKAAAPKM